MTEEEYEALDAMPLELAPGKVLPARLPNGKPTPSAQVLNDLQSRGIITLITSQVPNRWALTNPSKYRTPEEQNEKGAGSKSGP